MRFLYTRSSRLIVCATLFIVAILPHAKAQKLSFQEVDSISYQYYLQKNWKDLIKLGENAKQDGISFYFLNIRVGAAYFFEQNYYKAERFFQKAHSENNQNPVLNDYLHWTYFYLGNEYRADEYETIPDGSSENEISRGIQFVYAEAGRKFSSKKDSAGSINYVSAGAGQKVNPNLKLFYTLTHLDQHKNVWGEYGQQQIYLGSSVNLHHGYEFQFNVQPSFYLSKIDYRIENAHETPWINGPPLRDTLVVHSTTLKGKFNQTGILFNTGATKSLSRFTFLPFCNLYFEFQSPDYSVINTDLRINRIKIQGGAIIDGKRDSITHVDPVNVKATSTSANFGMSVSYVLPFAKNHISLKGKCFFPVSQSGNGKIIFSPEARIRLGKKSLISASYFYKDAEIVADEYGSVMYNNYDVIHRLLTFGFNRKVSEKVSLYFILQNEGLSDSFSLVRYQLNSLIINLTITL